MYLLAVELVVCKTSAEATRGNTSDSRHIWVVAMTAALVAAQLFATAAQLMAAHAQLIAAAQVLLQDLPTAPLQAKTTPRIIFK